MRFLLFAAGLAVLSTLPVHAQLIQLPLDGNLDDTSSNGVVVSSEGALAWDSDANRNGLTMPEDDGLISIPTSVSSQLDDNYNFDIQVDFRFPAHACLNAAQRSKASLICCARF